MTNYFVVARAIQLSPQSHQSPENGIEDLHSDGVARDDGESPLVYPILERSVYIQTQGLSHGGVTTTGDVHTP